MIGTPGERHVPAAPAHDREIVNADILPYAKSRCKLCTGGIIKLRVSRRGGGTVSWDVGFNHQERLCGCAIKRFMLKNEGNVLQEGDKLFWRAGTAPPLPVAPPSPAVTAASPENP